MKENANRQYRQIVKYIGYFGGVQGLNILAALVRNKVVAVLLGPIGLGLISLYNTAVKLIGDTTNLGIPVSSVRYLSECQEEPDRCRMVATVRLWSLLTAALGAVVCCVLVPFFRLFYFSTEMRFAEFLWLVPVVALTAVTAGELSILKGLQRMHEVATQSVVNAMLSLVVTLPLFWLLGNEGILPALVAAAVAASVTVLWFSLRVYPYRLPRSFRQAISAGGGMVRLGVAFVIAGAMGSGVEFAVRAFIANSGTLADVGLYNAGYVVTVTYASIVFMSMETEYFPRLSAVNHDEEACNATINRQIEVSVLLLAPLLVAFMLLLPFVIHVLYSSMFLPALGMIRFGVVAMLLRAVMLPMEYMSLAKGRPWIYLLTEGVYDIAAVGAVVAGYSLWGIDGAGAGLLVAAVFNCVIDFVACRHYYRYRIAKKSVKMFSVQILPLIASYFVSVFCTGALQWVLGVALFGMSAAISYRVLERESGLMTAIINKFKRKHDEGIDSDSSL